MLCEEVLARPELAADPRFGTNPKRVANRPALDAIINEVFASAPRENIIERLEAARIAYGRVSGLEDLRGHPQNRYVDVQSPAGPVRLLAPGMIFNGASLCLGPVPAIGEHSETVREEFSSGSTRGSANAARAAREVS
jgi:crotonobetainyl-CoA:carnitine CoA-transferase CaiB-like acyl-CoA transferase